jgi:hypothetical protein
MNPRIKPLTCAIVGFILGSLIAPQVIDAYRFYRLKPQVDMYQSIKECEASNMGWSVLDIEDRLHVACLPDAGDSYEL